MNIDKIDVYVGKLSRAIEPILTPHFKCGGQPVFISDEIQPICRNCGQEMLFLAQMPLDTPLKLSKRYRMAYIFMCPGKFDQRGWLECKTWMAFSGANSVVLQEDSGQTTVAAFASPYPDYAVTLTLEQEPNIDVSERTQVIDEAIYEQVFGTTKLGGVPHWLQNNETPTCPSCLGPMQFVGQLSAELDGPLPANPSEWARYKFFDFGAVGIGYLFLCEHEAPQSYAAFLWQTT
jgi:hypothetical protein